MAKLNSTNLYGQEIISLGLMIKILWSERGSWTHNYNYDMINVIRKKCTITLRSTDLPRPNVGVRECYREGNWIELWRNKCMKPTGISEDDQVL